MVHSPPAHHYYRHNLDILKGVCRNSRGIWKLVLPTRDPVASPKEVTINSGGSPRTHHSGWKPI